MKSFHPPIILFFIVHFFMGISTNSWAQGAAYTKEVAERIRQVEVSLAGQIQTQDTIKWLLKERMDFHKIPGVSIAVIRNYKLDWAKAYGYADTKLKRPVTTQTVFQAASISKSLNAVGMLKLVQDQQLDLKADINDYLTSWKFPYDSISRNKKIAIANLLSHTAGLSIHGFPGYSRGDTLPAIYDMLDGIKKANTGAVRSKFEPGLRYQYSGGGTMITQLMIQDLTRKSYAQYQYEKVLKPMGMLRSSFLQPPPASKSIDYATAYYANGNEVKGKFHIYPEQAPAGLWTNPTDLAKFIVEMQLCYQGKSKKVLSTESVKLMMTPIVDATAALGVFIVTKGAEKYFQHGGANEGFRCQYYGSLENGNGVVVMVNSDNGSIIPEIINSVATVYQWKGFYNPVIRKIIPTPADELLTSYTGRYEITPQFILTITKENGQLKCQATGQEKFDIYPEAVNKFFLTVTDAQVAFIKDENGQISKAILYQQGRVTEAKKIQ